MEKGAKIYVAGHRGLVGSAIVRLLEAKGYTHILTKTSKKLDLRSQAAVNDFFNEYQPEYIFLAAAKVGGIWANATYPAEFIYDNLMIETNIIHAAHACKAKKLLFLGELLHIPEKCATAAQRRVFADRRTGTH